MGPSHSLIVAYEMELHLVVCSLVLKNKLMVKKQKKVLLEKDAKKFNLALFIFVQLLIILLLL
jgi:hypothetical protein